MPGKYCGCEQGVKNPFLKVSVSWTIFILKIESDFKEGMHDTAKSDSVV